MVRSAVFLCLAIAAMLMNVSVLFCQGPIKQTEFAMQWKTERNR